MKMVDGIQHAIRLDRRNDTPPRHALAWRKITHLAIGQSKGCDQDAVTAADLNKLRFRRRDGGTGRGRPGRRSVLDSGAVLIGQIFDLRLQLSKLQLFYELRPLLEDTVIGVLIGTVPEGRRGCQNQCENKGGFSRTKQTGSRGAALDPAAVWRRKSLTVVRV